MDDGHRFEIYGDRLAIGVRQARGTLDYLGHRPTDLVKIGGMSVGQHANDVVLGPIADTGLAVRRDVRDLLAVGTGGIPGEKAVRFHGAEPVARCVTFSTMAKGGNE